MAYTKWLLDQELFFSVYSKEITLQPSQQYLKQES